MKGLNLDAQRVVALKWPSTCLWETTLAPYCQQTLSAEITSWCKQYEEIFPIDIGEQQLFL